MSIFFGAFLGFVRALGGATMRLDGVANDGGITAQRPRSVMNSIWNRTGALSRQAGLILCAWLFPAMAGVGAAVEVREETIVLPTYVAGEPEPNPMFYFGRASQGAEGRVYPYPLYDTLTWKKEDRPYRLIYLENEHIRIAVMPEIGGRLFEGVDKSNGYHFIYRQNVIKPALIGLIGAWISGGIEWNIPHHHRATTFIPVQHRIERHADGSATVWVGELEIRHRTRWAVGYTVHPGKSYVEARLRIVNRTPHGQTMLCFANIAVHATDDYQVIFPPRTRFVTHHHKREFTTWPVATGRYGGYDFGAGVDVSWYTNHIAANSMFAWNYEDDFMAGYDHGLAAGLITVADHHVVPGKKLWTWGTGPRGRMWDQLLTDDDGPYLELMVGAYSDNQPDYSWLHPFETRSFEIFWYPVRDIGGVKNATLEAAVNLEPLPDGTVLVGFHATSTYANATARLIIGDRVWLEEPVAIDPAQPWVRRIKLPSGSNLHELRASLWADGRELVACPPLRLEPEPGPMPDPVRPPAAPESIETNDELYFTGLWIEQFHHPTLDPDPYWEEALRRDPGDARVNTAFGINRLKRARYAEAEAMFRRALERTAARYAAPKDGEALYYLGATLKAQGRLDEAFDAFYQATWSAAWQSAGYHALAEIACHRGDRVAALDFVNRSLAVNALHLRALNLKAAVLRHLGRQAEAREVLVAARMVDQLDVRALAESWLLDASARSGEQLVATFREHPATALETAAEYHGAGLWGDGMAVLERAVDGGANESGISPLVYYYLASFAAELGETDRASHYRRLAAQTAPDHWFPFQDELIPILREAMDANPADARAPYHLGNLLFDWQPDKAVKLWERSAELDPSFPIVHRNLGIAYSHQAGGNILDQAIASLERAVALPDPHALHFTELDELYEAAGVAPEPRLALLERHAPVVARRDDALSRAIALKILMGRCDEAIGLMTGRRFDVWEGASISVAEHWIDAHLLRGHEHRAAGRYAEARKDYETALNVPDNLPTERRGTASRLPEVRFWSGMAHAGLGRLDDAHQAWQESAGTSPGGARRVGEAALTQRSAQQYYQARALEQLGRTETAIQIYRELVAAGQHALTEETTGIDFFASFGTQQSQRSRLALAHHVAGLGHLGLGETERAREQFERAIEISPDHPGARSALRSLKPASAAKSGRENGGGGAATLHVLSYNLWDGFGPKPEPRRDRWLEWMTEQRADVAALQELNGYTPERLASEARGWGHAYSVLLKEDGHPTGLTSGTPITEIARIRVGMHHGLLRGKTRGIYFYVIHFHPSNFVRRIEEAGHLLKDIAQLPDRDARIVLIGDFNGFSPDDRLFYEQQPAIEPFFAMLDERYPGAKNLNAGRLDYGGIKRILEAGYLDVIARLRPPEGPFAGTFPTELRRDEDLGPDRRIDYIFVSLNLAGTVRAARIIRDETTALLSDHYPLEAVLAVP